MKRFSLFLAVLIPSLAAAQDFRYTTTQSLTPFPTSSGAAEVHALDASTDGIGLVFIAPEAATVTQLCYLYGARTGTPPEYKIAIEGVSASTGDPDGTPKTGTGECSKTFTPPADTSIDGTYVCQTLVGTTCAVTRGETFAITIRYSSGTVDGSNYSTFAFGWTTVFNDNAGGIQAQTGNNIYSDKLTAGTWSKQANVPLGSWKNGSRHFGNPLLSVTQRGYSSDSTPDERALRFQYPCPTGQQFQLAGVGVGGDSTCSAGKTVKAILYTGTTPLQDVTLDCDRQKSLNANRQTIYYFDETDLTDLDCGTTYRVGIQPQEASSGMSIGSHTVSANGDFDAWPLGKETYMSHRTDAGAWTDVTTERLNMTLIIDNLNAVSSGGLKNHNHVAGGSQ